MLLTSPPNLHYPITIKDIYKRAKDEISRSTVLFLYTYVAQIPQVDISKKTYYVERNLPTKFESNIDGVVVSWKIKPGDVVRGVGVPLVEIEEPCRHDVQFGGMCAQCGKDLTEVNYNTVRPDTERAKTSIVPAHTALRISNDEANRLDKAAKQRLLDQKKLSLVVDLDLTVIQATVETTIGDWQSDPQNPNHEAVKDVRSFALRDDFQGQQGPDVMYYVKMRPGLGEFLDQMSKHYELHIYTMGTRAYAENIAKIIDPNQKYFGDRILSRTETPGEVSKNLRKLFPIDSKMVVIIDDRADVWRYSNYLVPVVPYNFFVGIGDINSSFLPKREDMIEKLNKAASVVMPDDTDDSDAKTRELLQNGLADESNAAVLSADGNGSSMTLDSFVELRGGEDATDIDQQNAEQDEALTTQIKEKPLLQKQKELDEMEETIEGPDHSKISRQPLLQDTDRELERIGRELSLIHQEFYQVYQSNLQQQDGSGDLTLIPDVSEIMEPHRTSTLKDAVIVFSGVIQTFIPVHLSSIARTAKRLGARVDTELTAETTHLVTRPGDLTAKIRKALRRPKIKIVSTDWIFESSVRWTHLDENPYKIDFGPIQPLEETEENEDLPPNNSIKMDEPSIRISADKEEEEAAEDEDELPIDEIDGDFDASALESDVDFSDLSSEEEDSDPESKKRRRNDQDEEGHPEGSSVASDRKRRKEELITEEAEEDDEDEFALLEAQLAASEDGDGEDEGSGNAVG